MQLRQQSAAPFQPFSLPFFQTTQRDACHSIKIFMEALPHISASIGPQCENAYCKQAGFVFSFFFVMAKDSGVTKSG